MVSEIKGINYGRALRLKLTEKLVDTSALHDPEETVLRQSITNDFFFPSVHMICAEISLRGWSCFANSQPPCSELVGFQSPCLADAPRLEVERHWQWGWTANFPA